MCVCLLCGLLKETKRQIIEEGSWPQFISGKFLLVIQFRSNKKVKNAGTVVCFSTEFKSAALWAERKREGNTKCVSISEDAQKGISIVTTSTDV